MKKIFGGINLTWKVLIISSILLGIYTALVAIIPSLLYTSFHSITATFELWILFGIIIIMNSKSNKDSAIKCFVFFLISQPIIYLLQVPFSFLGWRLFSYYKYWFIWTVLCLPMGYIGYYLKKDKWYSYMILFPMILLTLYSYNTYLSYFLFSYPKYILITLFCIGVLYIYPIYIFNNKRIKIIGTIISTILIISVTLLNLLNLPVYSTEILSNNNEHSFDSTYKVYLKDKKYGNVKIHYLNSIEDYMIHADFKKEGKTILVIENPNGEKKEYNITIRRDTYKINKRRKS